MEQMRPVEEEIKVEDGTGGSSNSGSAETEHVSIDLTEESETESKAEVKPHVIIDLIRKTEGNSEFGLESLLEEPNSHKFYCPNCKACIQKIDVRKDEPVECTFCYSFLVLIGNRLVSICNPGAGDKSPSSSPRPRPSPSPQPLPSPGLDTPAPSQKYPLKPGPSRDPLSDPSEQPLPNPNPSPVPLPPLTGAPAKKWDILKSIVYGGLIESITSLNIVTSAAGADVTALRILALGLANLIGGLFVIGHNLIELRNDQPERTSTGEKKEEEAGRYHRELGQRQNFKRHVAVTLISFLLFGMVAPVTYSFSFLKSDNKDMKLIAVAAASLPCITMLATAKAYIHKASNFYGYIKIILSFVIPAFMASGVSYVVGDLIKKLLEKLGLFDSSSSSAFSLSLVGTGIKEPRLLGFY